MAMQPPYSRNPSGGAGIEASSLYCPKCKQAQPVRKKLLLVLPTGDKYAYFCAVCGEQVGSKMEESPEGPKWIIT